MRVSAVVENVSVPETVAVAVEVGARVGVEVGVFAGVVVRVAVAVGTAGVCVAVGVGALPLQPGSWNEPMRVRQGEEPVVCTYSLVYQNVQLSTGSTDKLL